MDVILTTATAAAGVILTAYALVGDLKDRAEAIERIGGVRGRDHAHCPRYVQRPHRRGPGRCRNGPSAGAAALHGQRRGLIRDPVGAGES